MAKLDSKRKTRSDKSPLLYIKQAGIARRLRVSCTTSELIGNKHYSAILRMLFSSGRLTPGFGHIERSFLWLRKTKSKGKQIQPGQFRRLMRFEEAPFLLVWG